MRKSRSLLEERVTTLRKANAEMKIIRFKRLKLGLTQLELAEKARVGQSEISRIESGKLIPSDNQLEKLATALSVPFKDRETLLDEVEDQ
jgi:transcriptional regulator with XRE-family HTH domain